MQIKLVLLLFLAVLAVENYCWKFEKAVKSFNATKRKIIAKRGQR